MRNCPHCGKEIQDEAAFCRFCRRDVSPPLWLTSLQKCPYCAEWVERGIERCPLCGKALTPEEPFYISEEEDSKERLLNEVRQNIFSKGQNEAEDLDESEETPAEVPAFQSVPRNIEKDRGISGDPFESQEGLGVLRERQRDQVALDPVDDLSQMSDDEPKPRRPNLPLGKIFSWLFLIISSVTVIAIAIYAIQNFDLLGSMGIGTQLSPTDEVLVDATETSVEGEIIPTPTYAAAILPPEATEVGSTGPCMLWSEITPEMEGQQICAYGIIKRRFRVDDEIPYMAIFSEDEGTFAIVDRGTFYTQFRPGDCIQTEGEIELMRSVRPYIDAKNALSICPNVE